MFDRLLWWRRPRRPEVTLTGWALPLDEAALTLQLEEARNQASALLAFIADQDSKAVTLFGLTVLLSGASGVFGTLEVGRSPSQLADVAMLLSTAFAWVLALLAYRPRRFDVGLSPPKLRDGFSDIPGDQLSAFALEVWTNSFSSNVGVMHSKSRWLRWLMRAVVVQAALVLLVEVS